MVAITFAFPKSPIRDDPLMNPLTYTALMHQKINGTTTPIIIHHTLRFTYDVSGFPRHFIQLAIMKAIHIATRANIIAETYVFEINDFSTGLESTVCIENMFIILWILIERFGLNKNGIQ